MIVGIIPARYASSRFPGKPLIDIKGKSMLQRVFEQAKKSTQLNKVIVATDDQRIYDHVFSFGGDAVMTSPTHPSGTDRCFEAVQKIGQPFQYVINIQGDEPFIDPSQIDTIVSLLKDGTVEIATLIIPVTTPEMLFNNGEVKVVLNNNMEALYFSRTPIPFIKDVEEGQWHTSFDYYRHVGMYAYRTDVLEKITRLPVSSLEKAESLEQLRWLQNGFTIKCAVTDFESHCIDTPEDLEALLHLL